MAFFIAGATLAVGAFSAHQAGKASDRAGASSDAATALGYENLDFAKEQYQDWKDIYGGIEQNLSDFYTNLTPDYIEAQGLQSQQLEYQKQQQELTDYFATNDIEAGIQSDIFAKTSMQNVRDKAQIRADAPIKTAEQKQGFLSLGLNQKSSATNAVSNANTNLQNTLSTDAVNQANAANQGYEVAGDLFKQGVTQIVTANQDTKKVGG